MYKMDEVDKVGEVYKGGYCHIGRRLPDYIHMPVQLTLATFHQFRQIQLKGHGWREGGTELTTCWMILIQRLEVSDEH